MKVKDLLHLDPETEILLWVWDEEVGSRYYIANPTCSSMHHDHPEHFDIIINLCRAYEVTHELYLKETRDDYTE